MNRCGFAPVTFYLQKQAAGKARLGSQTNSLLTSGLYNRKQNYTMNKGKYIAKSC